MVAKVISLEQINPSGIYKLMLKTEVPINNEPGQYAEFYLPHNNSDNRGEKRFFTIYSSPTEPYVSIITKITTNLSSYKKALLAIKPGDIIHYTEPIGDFILPINKALPLIFIAGGIGISPFRSILKNLDDNNQKRDIKIYYSAKKQESIVDKDLFDKFNTRYAITHPITGSPKRSSRLNIDFIIKDNPINSRTKVYIAGPEPFIKDLSAQLINHQHPKNNIITDIFTGY